MYEQDKPTQVIIPQSEIDFLTQREKGENDPEDGSVLSATETEKPDERRDVDDF